MANYKNRVGYTKQLDYHVATGAESTYTITPASTITKTSYTKITINIQGASTASFALQLQLNGVTSASSYQSKGFRSNGATITSIDATGQDQIQIASSGLISGAHAFCGTIEIMVSTGKVMVKSQIVNLETFNSEYMFGTQDTATNVTSIKLMTSTSTWITGTQITTYGIVPTI